MSSTTSSSSSSFSISGMIKRQLSKSVQKATDFYLTVSGSPYKQLRTAIMSSDEERAIDIYTKVRNGKSLEIDLNPSLAFPIKKYMHETPLHLACMIGLKKLIITFIEHGGSPCAHNGRNETCLHTIVNRSDRNNIRLEVLEYILSWRGVEIDGYSEKVSINQVDIDGNAALHYAARSGLINCVLRLLSAGSIISLVNKDQKTCCEMADEQNFKELAHLLELALVFQPDEELLMNYDGQLLFPYERRQGVLFLSSKSINEREVDEFIIETITNLKELYKFDSTHVEVLLDCNSWNSERLKKELKKNLEVCITNCNLQMGSVIKDSERRKKDKLKSKSKSINEKEGDNINLQKCDELTPQKDVKEIDISILKEEVTNEKILQKDNLQLSDDINSSNHILNEYNNDQGIIVDNTNNNETFINKMIIDTVDQIIDKIATDEADHIQNKNAVVIDIDDIFLDDKKTVDSDISEEIKLPTSLNLTLISSMSLNNNSMDINPFKKSKPKKQYYTTIDESCSICGDSMTKLLSSSSSLKYALKLSQNELENYAIGCGCGHKFCFTCWKGNSTVQIMDSGSYTLKCPAFKCGEILSMDWAQVLLCSPELCERLSTQRRRHVVDCCPSLKWCPIDGCDNIIKICLPTNSFVSENTSLPQSAMCSQGHSFCISCSSIAHTPCSCEQWQLWFQKISEETKNADTKSSDDIANALWVAANTKRCPRCSTAIEKDEGCNHMTCRKCRHDFCWICMEDWSLHSNSTGGYFQCNRFVESQNESALNRLNDQSGNAHMETFRIKQQAKRMSRFIHHFTRFKAHADSAIMERKMHGETISRIRSELDAAITSKSFSWLQKDDDIVSRITEVIEKIKGESNYKVDKNGKDYSESSINDDVLQFLHDGYEELNICRQILSASYAYTFFEFSDDDEYVLSNSKLTIRMKYSRMDERKRSFEFLQSELEFLTELLSDVVARRRLRASRSQIIHTMKAAKSKRIELEDVILSYRTLDDISSSEKKNRKSSGKKANSLGALVEDEPDIAAFLSHLEMQHAFSPPFPGTYTNTANSTPRRTPSSTNATLASRIGSTSSPSTSNVNETPVNIRVVNSNRGSPRSLGSRRSSNDDFNRPRDTDPLNDESISSQQVLTETPQQQGGLIAEGWQDKLNRLLANGDNDINEDSIIRLRERAEEEEALNAAILMSLQENYKQSLNTPNTSDSLLIIKEEDLNQLLNMGFDKESCITALRNSNNNIDQAINRLLNI